MPYILSLISLGLMAASIATTHGEARALTITGALATGLAVLVVVLCAAYGRAPAKVLYVTALAVPTVWAVAFAGVSLAS